MTTIVGENKNNTAEAESVSQTGFDTTSVNDSTNRLLAQEVRLENLEEMNKKLMMERRKLIRQCSLQAERIQRLEALAIAKNPNFMFEDELDASISTDLPANKDGASRSVASRRSAVSRASASCNGSDVAATTEPRSTQRTQQTLAIEDLPMLDASEFLPVVDVPEKETTTQRLIRQTHNLAGGLFKGVSLTASNTNTVKK